MKKLLLLFFMATLCVAAMAQNDTIGLCGYSAQYVSQVNARSTGGAQSLSVLDKPTDFPANAIITCGRFTLYFQDIKNSTGQGFNHPTLGMLRRNCLCSVFSYIESVVQIAPVSPSNPVGASSQIEIEVGLSFDANATILGIASPYYAQNQIGSTTPGIFAGNPFTHITTGIDPEINAFDGVIMINFNNNPRITSDCSAAKAACDFDLFSIALHEMTHALGFASYIVDGGAGSPKSYSTVNQFTRFDNLFLFYGDLTSTKIKLLNGSSPANPVLNTGTNIANDKIWLYNSSTKTNQPISSRAALSHFDDRYRLGRCHDAPGFVPNYLMTGEGLSSFQIKREYTMQELRFLQQYGYTINPTYTNFSIIPNSPPYLLYNVGEGMITNNTSGPQSFIETLSGLPAITRLTPITSCQTKTITLGSSFGLIDENGDPIRIYPGSLTNLRGCGNGNNHNQLAVNSLASGDVITFTPRNNFIGLVQFGFHAWDGKEKGAFVVYSFYVTKDNACFNVTNELVINGSFEEGVELTTTLTPAIQNNLLYNSRFLSPESFPTWSQINGHWGGSKFIDGTFLTMQTVDVPIRNSHQNCVFGLSYENIPASEYPIPSGNNGNRYLSTLGETILAQLTENIQPCVRYKIEFDYFQNPPYGGATLNNNSNFIIGFLDTYNGLGGNGAGYGSSTINLPASVNIWTHFVGTVSVPSNIPVNCNLLSIVDYKQNASDPTTRFHIDNLSFMKDVTGACACNSQLPATINTNYTNQSLSIAQTVTISGNITFNNCDILMGKNAVIRVLAGSTLTLTSTNATQFSHLHACGDMWDGIYIQPGGNLIINNSTLVEDAINGVVAVDGSSKYTINGAIFNKNYYSIKLLPTTVTSVATRSIINSVFTCRIFGANPNVATFISNASLLTPMTKATLRVPHAGESAYTGIDVNAITGNNLNIGNRTLPINIFDNLYYGVWAHSSNVFVKHNTFENMTGSVTQCVTTPQPCSPCATICSTTNYGYAIYAETPAAANTYTVQAGGALSNERNTFTDCYEAVHSVDYANVIARYNNISNIAATRGNYGIYALSDAGATIQLTNNTINNCATAINHTRQGVNTSGTVNINSNTINTSGGAITNYGILMQDLTTAQQSKNIFISNNIISGVENGITLNSVKASAQVSGNTITLNNVNPTGAIRYGIALNNTGSGPGGNYTYVNGNTINGGIASPVSTNIGIIGIYSSLSPTSTINCNTVNNTGRSIVFNNACGGTSLLNNTLNTAYDGIVLSNSGIIGQQGTLSSASDNLWAGAGTTAANFLNSQTLADLSNGPSSPFYVRNTAVSYNPLSTKNKWINFPAVIIPFNNTALPSIGCAAPGGGGGGSAAAVSFAAQSTGTTTAASMAVIDQQISGSIEQYPAYSTQSRIFNNENAYEYLQNNVTMKTGKYKQFSDSLSTKTIGLFNKFNSALQQNNVSMAKSINNSFTPINTIEQNQQTINNYLADGLSDGKYVLARNEKSIVRSIATQCPLTGGRAVYQARTLYNLLNGRDTTFVEKCKDNFANAKLKQDINVGDTSFVGKSNSFKLYPNPNDGTMQFDYILNEGEVGVLIIMDVMGKKIVQYNIANDKNTLAISEAALQNGVYFYRLTINDKVVKTDKLLIIK